MNGSVHKVKFTVCTPLNTKPAKALVQIRRCQKQIPEGKDSISTSEVFVIAITKNAN